MAAHNYEVPFEVVGEPYDYGLADSKYVEFSANGKKHHQHGEKAIVHGS
jgi:hypothetical protein